MSQDDLFTADPQPRKPGMSGTAKLLIGLGIGCGVVVLLCCGGTTIFWWKAQAWLAESMSNDPVEVRKSTSEIADLTVPDGFEPAQKMSFPIPFTDETMMTTVVYESDRDGSLVLTQFGQVFAQQNNAEQMKQQMRQSLKEKGLEDDSMAPLDAEDVENVDLQIRGQPASFTIQRGKDKQSGDEIWIVSGSFQGKGGPAMLILQAKTADMSREQIDALLNSIK